MTKQGESTGETVDFTVAHEPEIDARGRFRLELSTSATEYEEASLSVALRKDNTKLELCIIPIKEGKATAFVDLTGLDLEKIDIELEALDIAVIL